MVPGINGSLNGNGPIQGQDHKTHTSEQNSSDMSGLVTEFFDAKTNSKALHVKGSEELTYGFRFTRNVFAKEQTILSEFYKKWGRVLVVMDGPVTNLYADTIKAYFAAHDITPTIHTMAGGELNKNMKTMESLVDAFDAFGLIRKEPVLVVGGGLVTDVTGYACASYRRSSNFIRVPTTLIGLIDAAVSIKVGINHKKLKNRLGAYHAPMLTVLDFDFLKTLPEGQIRNGTAELVKISSVADLGIWKDIVKYGPELVKTAYGRRNGSPELIKVADSICERGIKLMLNIESPNLHEIRLDRIIAWGHTWSPLVELTPTVPLRHGHAITIDMAYGTTLAWKRGYITEQERDEFHQLAYDVGLSLDHPCFDEEALEAATAAILKTRDGKQWFAEPRPLGTCHFVNDASMEELKEALREHKQLIKSKYEREGGIGIDAFVDKSDLGMDPEKLKEQTSEHNASLKTKGVNGLLANGAAKDAGLINGRELECSC